MARRKQKTLLGRSFRRAMTAMARSVLRSGAKVLAQPRKTVLGARKRSAAKKIRTHSPGIEATRWIVGAAIGAAGVRAYRLYLPEDIGRGERLPLLVMLHGCLQDAESIAASSRMNKIAASERFLVLYPDQDRLANAQGCWNWYETRSGHAQREAEIIDAAIDHVCLLHAVDPGRIAVAGFSAGATMAALLAIRHPQRFRAIAMHSGIAPGVATSSASALNAMRGRVAPSPLLQAADGNSFPALLVIHGNVDHIVASSNGADAALLWANRVGAAASRPRVIQRGRRHSMTITDYRSDGELIASLCAVSGLGHAWSGGTAGLAYSDPKGPDASRMIWTFVAKQFARVPDRVIPIVAERLSSFVPGFSTGQQL